MANKINGIDVSEYFINVVDEGRSTIGYKILPNTERLLVEKIFEQNQQLKRLQEENKRLQMLSCANCGEKYLSPDGAELYEKNVQLQKENEELKENKGRCAFKCLDNTFCDEAKIKIDELELDKDCLNASLETARKYRGVAEAERDKYKKALEEIREIAKFNQFYNPENLLINGDIGQIQNLKMTEIYNKINEVLDDRD